MRRLRQETSGPSSSEGAEWWVTGLGPSRQLGRSLWGGRPCISLPSTLDWRAVSALGHVPPTVDTTVFMAVSRTQFRTCPDPALRVQGWLCPTLVCAALPIFPARLSGKEVSSFLCLWWGHSHGRLSFSFLGLGTAVPCCCSVSLAWTCGGDAFVHSLVPTMCQWPPVDFTLCAGGKSICVAHASVHMFHWNSALWKSSLCIAFKYLPGSS